MASELTQSVERDPCTLNRVPNRAPWRTFEAISSRLSPMASIRRQMKRIANLIFFPRDRPGGPNKLKGNTATVILRDFFVEL